MTNLKGAFEMTDPEYRTARAKLVRSADAAVEAQAATAAMAQYESVRGPKP